MEKDTLLISHTLEWFKTLNWNQGITGPDGKTTVSFSHDNIISIDVWEKFKRSVRDKFANYKCEFTLSQADKKADFSVSFTPVSEEEKFTPVRRTEGWISQLLNNSDIKGLDIRKVEDNKIEIYELGEPSQYPGKYVGRFHHNSPNVERYERYKDYFRYPIQLSAQSIIMIHHFSDRGSALDQVMEEMDMVENNDAAMKLHYNTWEMAAKQFFHQLEGHYCDLFLHNLIVEATKKLAASDKSRLEMSIKHEKICKDGGCNHSFENRAEKALQAAAEEIKEATPEDE